MKRDRSKTMEYVKKFQELIDNHDSVTCAACDCMGRVGGMYIDIHAESKPIRMAGSALTVRCVGGDLSAVMYAIEHGQEGDFLVIDSHGHYSTAYFGENICLSSINKGIKAAIMDGGCRDIEEIRKLEFPIYARGTCSNVGQIQGYGQIMVPITCAGVQVDNCDVVLIDGNGVAVVPYDDMEIIYEKTLRMMQTENDVSDKLRAGETIGHLINVEKLMQGTFNYQERALE